ncbi:XrtA/PEP-CTERM system histidine kinase PrsK [Massilia horti]|uniref:histidine kinase n=1 Tax=Massilia horti TaxID=2562153 RepID=A0A4Y9ST64_9BURK|nr:XrtA/PEP-CTERM system histidine kinase PrsK [Massilia horti]TFW29870.1 PEP-CTERM system histidine kinase PrsK [Massilia horti]
MTSIATFSYSLAAVGFLLLGALWLTSWRGRRHGGALSAACLLTASWAGLVSYQASRGVQLSVLADAVEILRNAAWSYVLVVLLGQHRDPASRLPFRLPRPVLAAAAVYGLFLLATVCSWWELPFLVQLDLMPAMMARLGWSVFGMLLVEQVYRNKPVQERWAIKFACLGIGGMFAYDFYMYSDALLFKSVHPDIWAARGVANALTVPLIGISMARSASWNTELAVSRRVMFHSAALFGSAIYLLAMGSAGYYLRFFGGSWGTLMQVTFLFAAVMLLAGILFSGTFRSWLKVFISKHFYTYNYDYREEWLRFTRTLSEQGPGLGERAIQAIAELVESPGGALWIRRESGVFEAAARWHVPRQDADVHADSPFCIYLESTHWVVDLHELARDPDKYEGLVIPDWLAQHARAWLVVPMMMHGALFGFVVLQQARSPVSLNWEVIDLLKIAGTQAASYLAQEDAANALMVARQFESFNRMSTFVVHDLKNLVSQLSLMGANAEKHRNNPEFQRDMLDTVNHSVQKMKLMLQKLGRSANAERPVPLAVEEVVRQAVALKGGLEPQPVLQVRAPGLTVLADRERLERVLGHLVQNAIEATPRDGSVTIELSKSGPQAQVAIRDTGAGMTEDFVRERLFKPFESTKAAGMGIGAFESREYIQELGGRLEVSSTPGFGTTFNVILPLHGMHVQEAAPAAVRQEDCFDSK